MAGSNAGDRAPLDSPLHPGTVSSALRPARRGIFRRRSPLVIAGALLSLVLFVIGILIVAPPTTAEAASSGLWKISCGNARSAKDDPIVLPGQPGASHMHDFFGNLSTNGDSTTATMTGVSSTCAHNDRAAYWTPALYRNGQVIKPEGAIVYYTNSISPGEERIEPYPHGFQMITGNAHNTDPALVSGHIEWGCLGDTQIGKVVPTHCASDGIQVRITFPSCWDGVTVVGNEAAHMAFPSGGKCAAAFPRALPTVRLNVGYQTSSNVGAITLSSGSVASIHADFWNIWDQPTLASLVHNCLNLKQDCGHFLGQSPGRAPGKMPTAPVTTMPGMPSAGPTPTPKPTAPGCAPAATATSMDTMDTMNAVESMSDMTS